MIQNTLNLHLTPYCQGLVIQKKKNSHCDLGLQAEADEAEVLADELLGPVAQGLGNGYSFE